MSGLEIRRPRISDVPEILEIYNYYVLHTHVTFDLEPRTIDQRLAWFAAFTLMGRHQCFVADQGTRVVGWACSAPFKEREAYATSVETSVYLAPGETGRGVGRALYESLFASLQSADVHRAYGGIAQPNEASVRLHERMGFTFLGTYREVGRKFGRFWNVAVYERTLAAGH